jgi:hypothetical protein
MKTLPLTCNHCGAPLQAPEGTRFLTCQFCSSSLEVQHSGNAVYTQVLDTLDQRTTAMANDIDEIKRQNELELLDRQWEREREEYLVRGKFGRTSVPSTTGSLIAMTIGVVVGIVWIGMAVSFGAPFFFPLFGVLFIMIVVLGSAGNVSKATRYRAREAEYERRRQLLRNR